MQIQEQPFSELPLDKLVGQSFRCACGEVHTALTRRILVKPGAIGELPEVLAECGLIAPSGQTRCSLFADERTFAVAGAQTVAALERAGVHCTISVIPGDDLHTDEHTLGHFLLNADDASDFLIAVGSGTINDAAHILSHKLGKPYVIVGTAPSMDGYASTTAPVIRQGFKTTLLAAAPVAVVCDTDVLCAAPQKMLAAGLGDVAAKLVALIDWKLGEIAQGELRCLQLDALMRRAVDKSLSSAPGLANRDPEAVSGLVEALILSGLAMQLAGHSRPASGCEHHLSHFWEMQSLHRGVPVSLHGDKVGVGTLMMLDAYGRLFAPEQPPQPEKSTLGDFEAALRANLGAGGDLLLHERKADALVASELACERISEHWPMLRAEALELAAQVPSLTEAIRAAGGPVTPAEVGADRKDTLAAIKYARYVRYERYTLLALLDDFGKLEAMAGALADDYA